MEHHQNEILITPLTVKRILAPNLWAYRHLLLHLVRKNIRVSNDSTYLTFLWASSRPLSISLIFLAIRDLSSAQMHVEMPYITFLYSGYAIWFYFLAAVTGSASSLLKDAALIKKVYFPRLIIPLVPVMARLHDLFLSCIPLVILCVWQKVIPGYNLLLLPVVLLLGMLIAFGTGTLFAAIGIESNDPHRLLTIILQLGMFVSPVIFSPDMIPQKLQSIYRLNPLVGVLMGFRAAIDGNMAFPYGDCLYSLGFGIALLAVALYIYSKTEISLADKI
jgi:lipopolysaccharide transport system permease protein